MADTALPHKRIVCTHTNILFVSCQTCYRGVPPEYSLKAAELLRCRPHEISAIKPAMSQARGAHELLPLHALLLKRIEDFDEAKMAQMFEAAGFIRNGIPLKPDPAHRSNNVITDKKLAESKQ